MGLQLHTTERSVIQGILLSTLLLSGCSAADNATQGSSSVSSGSAPMSAPMSVPMNSAPELEQRSEAYSDEATLQKLAQKPSTASDLAVAGASNAQKKLIPQQKTQLIKKAALGLRVQDVEKAVQEVSKAIAQHGGDLLGLQDQVPQENESPQQATLQIRVPQAELDATLAQLSKLGVIETRSIQAEDVATQIVDFESRLKNLRKSEEVVLGIMDRSGSVGDVLKVSQQLSQIRNEIEQIQGQVQHLKQQVAYSTISLTLKEAIAQTQKSLPVADRLQESWMQSTHAVGEMTVKGLRLVVWLLVFSPYLAVGAGLFFLGRKVWVRRSVSLPASLPAPSTPSEP